MRLVTRLTMADKAAGPSGMMTSPGLERAAVQASWVFGCPIRPSPFGPRRPSAPIIHTIMSTRPTKSRTSSRNGRTNSKQQRGDHAERSPARLHDLGHGELGLCLVQLVGVRGHPLGPAKIAAGHGDLSGSLYGFGVVGGLHVGDRRMRAVGVTADQPVDRRTL